MAKVEDILKVMGSAKVLETEELVVSRGYTKVVKALFEHLQKTLHGDEE